VRCRIVCDFVKVDVKLESLVSRADLGTFGTPPDAPFRGGHNGAAHVCAGLLRVCLGRDK
jgi:hypothetical protein